MSNHDLNRRNFLMTAGAVAAGAGLGANSERARAAVAHADREAPTTGRLLEPDEVMGIGVIGVGGKGGSHLKKLLEREKSGKPIEVRAVSDCYKKRQEDRCKLAKHTVDRDIEAYFDYRDVLERDDIHSVVIATPDHWHAQIAIDAMRAGKDVYCEKPVTLTVEESLDVRDVAYETGRVFQCGAQRTSNPAWRAARDLIRRGGIGKVLYAQSDYSRNSGTMANPQGGEWNYPIDEEAIDNPDAGSNYIDWTQWLGTAPHRSFSAPRFFQFRKFWDYSGGIATDLLYHVIAPLVIALDADAPEKVVGQGGIYVQRDDREVPDTFFVNAEFPGDYSVVLTSTMANSQSSPTMIRGHRATIYFESNNGGKIVVKPEREFAGWFKKEHGVEELVIDPGATDDKWEHMSGWLEACRTREECNCTAETAYKAMAVTRLACDSYRNERALFWDGRREVAVDRHPRPERASKFPVDA